MGVRDGPRTESRSAKAAAARCKAVEASSGRPTADYCSRGGGSVTSPTFSKPASLSWPIIAITRP